MDSDRFDRLTRTFATTSRRQLLPLLTGTAFAGTMLNSGWQEAAARCRRRRRCPKPIGCCPKGTRCLNGGCFKRGDCPSEFDCFNSPLCSAEGTSACFCGVTTEGNPICWLNVANCANPDPCTKSSECDPGRVCLDMTTCTGCAATGSCVEPCPSPA